MQTIIRSNELSRSIINAESFDGERLIGKSYEDIIDIARVYRKANLIWPDGEQDILLPFGDKVVKITIDDDKCKSVKVYVLAIKFEEEAI